MFNNQPIGAVPRTWRAAVRRLLPAAAFNITHYEIIGKASRLSQRTPELDHLQLAYQEPRGACTGPEELGSSVSPPY